MGLIRVESPACYIKLMCSLIIEITVSGLPEPVPIIRMIICMKITDDSGAFP